MNDRPLQIVGRTGSLFTRLPLIFAEEMGIAYELVVIDNLASTESEDYAGNPALRMPILRENDSVIFGAQNICRALAKRSATPVVIVWPEDARNEISCNAQELVSHSMAAQVQILMGVHVGELPEDNVILAKARAGLEGSLGWLDKHAADVLAALPQRRDLSFFEVALYCLIDHLKFGQTVTVDGYATLLSFADQFGTRRSVQRTAYR